jgi:pyruvate,water dikinase
VYDIVNLSTRQSLDPRLGLKALNLARLEALAPALGYAVPPGIVIPPRPLEDLLRATLRPGLSPAEAFGRIVELRDLDAARRWRDRLALVALPRELLLTLHQCAPQVAAASADGALVVRSSFHAEDRPRHSFAGIFDTALDVVGVEMLCRAVRSVYASLLSDRAISYLHAVQHSAVPAMSVIIQPMVARAGGLGGVLHSLAPDVPSRDVLLLAASSNAASVTSGEAIPEEYLVYRPHVSTGRACLITASAGTATAERGFAFDERSIRPLARLGVALEEAFGAPVEIEWARAADDVLWLLQARELPQERAPPAATRFTWTGEPLVTGLAVGQGEFTGRARRTDDVTEARHLGPGDVLVTRLTNPDWEAALAGVGALVTEAGGRTSHAARLARERGKLAIVGCGAGIQRIADGDFVTLVCTDGLGGSAYPAAAAVPLDSAPPDAGSLMLLHPGEAFSVARHSSPTRVDVRLESVVRALRLPSRPHRSRSALSPAVTARIAGYATVDAFLEAKLRDSLALVCAAFPRASVRATRLDPPFDADTPLLETAVAALRRDYGFPVEISPRTYSSSERLAPHTTS